jgi:hypothetical protein
MTRNDSLSELTLEKGDRRYSIKTLLKSQISNLKSKIKIPDRPSGKSGIKHLKLQQRSP